ncbi:MAG TPA: N-acetyltransferase [Candidatus Eisenbacteria bacterium]|nr:N-acetyltransferase [Candidatus Eisenbacteria bacterium]
MSSEFQIIPLSRQPKDVHRFLQVSYGVYRNDPLWVAPLLMDLKKVFSDRNPLFQHAEMNLWVATHNGRDVGRIAGIWDRAHNETQQDSAAFFGFFESIDDRQVSGQLFEAVFSWARQKNLRRVLGPMNPTSNDECGLLVEGFDSSPVCMMTYNPRYYVDLVLAAGFQKAKDLLAFHFGVAETPLERLERIAAKFRHRQPNLKLRPVRRKTLAEDLAKIKEVYNEAWEQNWGFVPMTDAELNFMAARLKPMLMEGLIWLVEAPDEAAGFLLALPDFNEAIRPLRGRLLTPKILGFLPYLFGWKKPALVRAIILGVKEKFRGRGLESAMLAEGLKASIHAGFHGCEASWILEDNVKIQRVIEFFGGTPYKTYRLYERNL